MTPRLRFWLFLLALILFSRVFQSQVLWSEEGLPLAAAQQMLAGSVLYRDIWFDKPPVVAWFHAVVLRAAGYNLYGLRMIGAVYILVVSLAGYALARRLWDEAAARWAAFFLAFFTGFYVHSAALPLAADLLLVLPHLATFYFLAAGQPWLAGLAAGFGFHANLKALFVLAAAAGWILLEGERRRLAPLLGGFALATGAVLAAVAATGGWSGYREQVWRWGAQYAGASFSDQPWALGLRRTANYFGFHAALVIGAAAFFWRKDGRRRAIALWLAVSFIAVLAGLRFFPRYYFQILPPLAIAAGVGWSALARRRVALAALAVALVIPAVRFGRVNLWLAMGRPFAWRDVAIDADSRRAAAVVTRFTDPKDRVFVWGFRPEIYFYSRRLGASRYLECQPLTGVPADRHLERSGSFETAVVANRRTLLALELVGNLPPVIVDGLGPYNSSLAFDNYPELAPLLGRYSMVEQTAGTRIWRLLR